MAIRDDLEAFARQIGGDQLGIVEHLPEADMRPLECFANVARKVARDGGRARYGWIFQSRRPDNIPDQEYLLAIHHAVWNGSDQRLIDVTPFHPEARQHPLTHQDAVLFLWDASAVPLTTRGASLTLPIKFYPIGKDPRLLEYVRSLRRSEYQKMQAIRQAADDSPAGSTIDSNGHIIPPAES